GGKVSALWGTGFHKGTPATKNTLFWRDTNQDGAVQLNEISVLPAQASTPSLNFNRWAVGGDARVAIQILPLGELLLYGEVTYAANLDRFLVLADPVTANRDLRELGFYVGIVQELTPWAAIGFRYDRYDPDRDANDLRTGAQVPKDSSFATMAVAAAVRFPGYARLIAEYDHNDNALGRTLDGTPTTLASDAFTLRAEVKF
ncbi:MAG: phosphate-selective porin, partial [bacterium]|nr:phosphate-selective porin [bacterium]